MWGGSSPALGAPRLEPRACGDRLNIAEHLPENRATADILACVGIILGFFDSSGAELLDLMSAV
jgi:hypothetical protein